MIMCAIHVIPSTPLLIPPHRPWACVWSSMIASTFICFSHSISTGRSLIRSVSTFCPSSIPLSCSKIRFTVPQFSAKRGYKESDKLSGRQPIEFVQAARPIVIIDEPQSVDSTDKAQEAIKALNPLCTLRYSATHRNPYNLIYRLDPIRAFELKLVKQIVVASAANDGGANDALVRVEQIDYKKGIKAKLRIHVQTPSGPKETPVTVKNGDNLFTHSKERA